MAISRFTCFLKQQPVNHDKYKMKKYSSSTFEFEPEKIHIPGYGISPDGKVYDFIGLQEGLQILKRQKTY